MVKRVPFLLDHCYYLALDGAALALRGCGLSTWVTGKMFGPKSVCCSSSSQRLCSSEISLVKKGKFPPNNVGFYPNLLTNKTLGNYPENEADVWAFKAFGKLRFILFCWVKPSISSNVGGQKISATDWIHIDKMRLLCVWSIIQCISFKIGKVHKWPKKVKGLRLIWGIFTTISYGSFGKLTSFFFLHKSSFGNVFNLELMLKNTTGPDVMWTQSHKPGLIKCL